MTRRITAIGHGDPAIIPVRNDDRSNSPKRGCQLGDEHRRHAGRHGAPLARDGLQHGQRLERLAERTLAAPCVSAGKHRPFRNSDIAARNAYTVIGGEPQAFSNKKAIVHDVEMRERRALAFPWSRS